MNLLNKNVTSIRNMNLQSSYNTNNAVHNTPSINNEIVPVIQGQAKTEERNPRQIHDILMTIPLEFLSLAA